MSLIGATRYCLHNAAHLRRQVIKRSGRIGLRCLSTESTAMRVKPSTSYTTVTHPDLPPPEELDPYLAKNKEFLLPIYNRPPIVLLDGKGMYVHDSHGREYLDFSGGIAVNALGHADDGLAEVMTQQAHTLVHSSNMFYNKWAGELAELLVTLTKKEGGLGWAGASTPKSSIASSSEENAKVFFSNSGTESNEAALKIARRYGKYHYEKQHGRYPSVQASPDLSSASSAAAANYPKSRLVCFASAFHGRSMGSLSVTPQAKYQTPFAPLIPNIDIGTFNGNAEDFKTLITEETCGVIVEPVQGEGGIFNAKPEWLRALRERCNEVEAVLIFDEVQCGLYRTGAMWAHSSLPVECHPDIVTMAKPLANGFPIGAVLMRNSIAEVMVPGMHGTTFGGNPLACSLGHYVLSRLSQPSFVRQIRETSKYMYDRLSLLADWFPTIVQPTVRGRGMIVGVGLHNSTDAGKLVGMARERGVLLLTAGTDAVRLVPSLTVGIPEVDKALDVLESCLWELSKHP